MFQIAEVRGREVATLTADKASLQSQVDDVTAKYDAAAEAEEVALAQLKSEVSN